MPCIADAGLIRSRAGVSPGLWLIYEGRLNPAVAEVKAA